MSDTGLTEIAIVVEPETAPVLSWRVEALLRAGYDEFDAIELALRRHVDLHRAIDLVRLGCPPETAVRILL